MRFQDRVDAARQLTAILRPYQDKDTVVLALPRGGVVVGAEIARALNAPLGIVLVRKLGHPGNPEYAAGAVAEDGTVVYGPGERAALPRAWRRQAEANARELLTYRRNTYLDQDQPPPVITGRTALLIDDGIATGLSMEAAVRSVRREEPHRIIVAAPVAAASNLGTLRLLADEVIILDNPAEFLGAVGAHYHDFPPVGDEEVRQLLQEESYVH